MQETMERLWREYFAETCTTLDTEEEKKLASKAIMCHQTIADLLTQEQLEATEKYIDLLCEIQSVLIKKTFFRGCEFSLSFLLEAGLLIKRERFPSVDAQSQKTPHSF